MRGLRFLLFCLFSSLALAQVGLVDGPRPATEVRGRLQGDARQGYGVVVEFLVEAGTDPVQGTTSQSLSWNGRLYLCVSGCDHFTLSGYTPHTPYNQRAFDLYDSQNRLRGRAGVTTVYDAQGRPSYHRVDYAVWPLQGTRTWMPSPDNPVPLEAGGWLSARPPGGSVRERYRYPGMESYQPPSAPGSVLSGISPADRDVVGKGLVSSLRELRQFYARQPRGSALWFFVPEVSAWTETLAREFRAQNGGQERFAVPEGTARGYCALYRNDPRYHVMPRESLAKEQAFAVIYPPSGATQKGAVMAGRHLVDRPDWQETDYLSFTTPLVPAREGLPDASPSGEHLEARAHVWGYVSRADLKARVEFREWSLSPTANWYASLGERPRDWDGTFQAVVGRGDETFRLLDWTPGSAWTGYRSFVVADGEGRNRGTAYVTASYTVDTSSPRDFGPVSTNGSTLTVDGEVFYLRNCVIVGRGGGLINLEMACELVDTSNRQRGTATYYPFRGLASGTLYPLAWVYTGYAHLKGWTQAWRPAQDNDRPVEAGGYVTAEGRRYRIPGLEGYLMPTGRDLEVAEGDPYVSYVTRSLSPQGNPLAGTGRPEPRLWFKPLRDWCAERGL